MIGKRLGFRFICISSFFSLWAISVFADTVRLKDGKIFKNVKSKIEGKTLRVENQDGSIQTFPIETLKAIEPGDIKIPETATAPNKIPPPEIRTEELKSKDITGPSTPIFLKPPGKDRSWLWAPVPFWSGLNEAPYTEKGIVLTFFKTFSFLLAAAYLDQPESATTNREKLGQLLLVRNYNQTGNDAALFLALSRAAKFRNQVIDPIGGSIISKDEHELRSQETILLFVSVALLDGFLTYFGKISPNSIDTSKLEKIKISLAPTLERNGSNLNEGFRAEIRFAF